MSGQDDQTPGVSPAEEEVLRSSVVPGLDNEASGMSPAEGKVLKTSVVFCQDNQTCRVCLAEAALKTSAGSCQDDQSSRVSPAVEEMSRPLVVSGQDEAFDASSDREEAEWDMCLFMDCDPWGRPYFCCDFEDAVRGLGLSQDDIAGLGKLERGWVIQLKTTEALQTLAKAGTMLVKGWYCAIMEPAMKETWMQVHCVPLRITNAFIREGLQEFGIVKKVSCGKWRRNESVVSSTTRHVRICLKEGMKVTDIPYLWEHGGETFLIAIRERPPFCLNCCALGHLSFSCPAPRRSERERQCLFRQVTGGARENKNVFVEPGETQVRVTDARETASGFEKKKEPEAVSETTAQHPEQASTDSKAGKTGCEPEDGSVSPQKTPPVTETTAEHPEEASTDTRTGSASCKQESGFEGNQATPPFAEITAEHPDEVSTDTETGNTGNCEPESVLESKQEAPPGAESTAEHPGEVSTDTETGNTGNCEPESGLESKQEAAPAAESTAEHHDGVSTDSEALGSEWRCSTM
nr:uncharacterized protein LOC126517363 [Dermacentor andersoni]